MLHYEVRDTHSVSGNTIKFSLNSSDNIIPDPLKAVGDITGYLSVIIQNSLIFILISYRYVVKYYFN